MLRDRYLAVPTRTPFYFPFPRTEVLTVPQNTCIANFGQTAANNSDMLFTDSLQELTNPYLVVSLLVADGRLSYSDSWVLSNAFCYK